MTDADSPAARRTLESLRDQLRDWLVGAACPLWSQRGIEAASGRFEESVNSDGTIPIVSRRARVQVRQIYAFTVAAQLGWGGDAARIARRGIDAFIRDYRRPDGLYRTRVHRDGAVLDDSAELYDQAFVLLGFAAAAMALDAVAEFEAHAQRLRLALSAHLQGPGTGFLSRDDTPDLRESNPHMHLLESCQLWATIGKDPEWIQWEQRIGRLALERMRLPGNGAIGEIFDAGWAPAGAALQRIEPGHQFEWAWLLLRGHLPQEAGHFRAATDLIGIGERYGVSGGFAINALHTDLTTQDPASRLWPQTERLKAAALAASLYGDAGHCQAAVTAARALIAFLETPLPGLWHDLRQANGQFAPCAAPASSFYHVVCAIAALDAALSVPWPDPGAGPPAAK